MAVFNLNPGQSANIPLSGKYLVARRVSGTVFCDDPVTQLPEFSLRQGDNVELTDNVRSVRITNKGTLAAVVDAESSPVRIYGNDGGAVSIIGGQLDSIRDSISVSATAVVNNGTVTVQSITTLGDVADIAIPANSRALVAAAVSDQHRTVFIQNISASNTSLRIGGATVAANRGFLLTGSINAPGAMELDCKGDLYVWNSSASPALVSVMTGVR
jgi:hypothetical protein